MLREWDPKAFFRKFSQKSLQLLEIWADGALALDGHGPAREQFYRAWQALAEDKRERLEAALEPLNDLCALDARPFLDDVARSAWANEQSALLAESEQWSVEELALRLFISEPAKFVGVHRSYAMAGDETYFEDPRERPMFCFDALRDPRFDFPTRAVDHVEDVTVVRVIARPGFYPARRILLDVSAGLRAASLCELLAMHGVNLTNDAIDGVHLRFQFEGSGRAKYRTVSLLNPHSSNLRDTGRDGVIRRYLREWGFDADAQRVESRVGRSVVAA